MRPVTYRFGPCEFSDRAGLSVEGRTVELRLKCSQLLSLLLRAQNAVVDRATIALTLWPQDSTSDAAIDRCAYLLRQALKPYAPDAVRSVYGQGFRIAPKVRIEPDAGARIKRYDEIADIGRAASQSMENLGIDDLDRIFEFAKTAILTNPGSPVALSAYADLAIARWFRAHMPAAEAKKAVRAATRAALGIDPNFAPALASLGWLMAIAGRGRRRGVALLEKALNAEPANGMTRFYKAWAHFACGDRDAALACALEAAAGSGNYRLENRCLAVWFMLCMGQYPQAREDIADILASHPDFDYIHIIAFVYHAATGAPARARQAAEKAARLSQNDGMMLTGLAFAHAAAGDPAAARAVYAQVESVRSRAAPPLFRAAALLALGREAEAADVLEQGKKDHCPWMVFMDCEPRLRAHVWRDAAAQRRYAELCAPASARRRPGADATP
jgi:DNA-binding winged helix-turn-helix (wHTH) protein